MSVYKVWVEYDNGALVSYRNVSAETEHAVLDALTHEPPENVVHVFNGTDESERWNPEQQEEVAELKEHATEALAYLREAEES